MFNHNGFSIASTRENYCLLTIIFQVIFVRLRIEQLPTVELIVVGSILPPHFSPFVEEKEGDYVPPERFGQRQTEEDVDEAPVETGNDMFYNH